MPRKERNERVPEPIAFHGFNNNRPQPPTEDVDIVHFAHQLFPPGLIDCEDVATLASHLQSRMEGKTFVVENRTYAVVKVFAAGSTCIKMRVQRVVLEQSGQSDMEAC